jgi:hypothetical protein
VTRDELASLIDEYEAGLQAELQLLGQLDAISKRQRDITFVKDYAAFNKESEPRERLTHALLAIEEGIKPIRERLAAHRSDAQALATYARVLARHKEAQELVTRILAMDRESLRVMTDAEAARRLALAGIEQGEMTLAAYRKVLAPPVASATLINGRG